MGEFQGGSDASVSFMLLLGETREREEERGEGFAFHVIFPFVFSNTPHCLWWVFLISASDRSCLVKCELMLPTFTPTPT